MKCINPAEVKSIRTARPMLTDLQKRIYQLENALDDLSRSVEIAQYTHQYNVTEVFVRDATELLQDRLVIEIPESNGPKITMVESSEDAWKQGVDILNEDDGEFTAIHGEITGVVDQDGAHRKVQK
jgi:mRNA-degrading endonuclease HigB of HigAB toxin-antitoxin module